MKEALIAIAVCVAFATANFIGWYKAHSTLALECLRLGKFYVGEMVFLCAPEPKK